MNTDRIVAIVAGMILVLSMGGLLLNVLLYQTNLVPRWLSGWGLAGTVVAIAQAAYSWSARLTCSRPST